MILKNLLKPILERIPSNKSESTPQIIPENKKGNNDPPREKPASDTVEAYLQYCFEMEDDVIEKTLDGVLRCEVCGGGLIGNPGREFEFICGNCGHPEWLDRVIDLTFSSILSREGGVDFFKRCEFDSFLKEISNNQIVPDFQLLLVIKNLLKWGFLLLEDGYWWNACTFFNGVLKYDVQCGEAYLGKLMAELHVRDRTSLCDCSEFFAERDNYQKAIRYGSVELRAELAEANERFLQSEQERPIRIELIAKRRAELAPFSGMIFCGNKNTVGLKPDGTVVTAGLNDAEQCDVDDWKDIVTISMGEYYTVGLKSDGTVVAVRDNEEGQCSASDWKDIVAISAGNRHVVGLKSDGTVVAVGDNKYDQCNVSNWKDIVDISAGDSHTVGLTADGTAVAVGDNPNCMIDIINRQGIVVINSEDEPIVIKPDGTVVYERSEQGVSPLRLYGSWLDHEWRFFKRLSNPEWKDIVAISVGAYHSVGLKADGTVVAAGSNYFGECVVIDWSDIVVISAGGHHTVGLKSDGTVVAVGDNRYGQCDVSNWRDIVAISTGESHTVGLKSDGIVVAVGNNEDGQCDVGDWKLFENLKDIRDRKIPGFAGRREAERTEVF